MWCKVMVRPLPSRTIIIADMLRPMLDSRPLIPMLCITSGLTMAELRLWEITVSNNPAYTGDYDSESFILYKYCGPETDLDLIVWTQIQIVTRSVNFNTPVVFSGLDEDCIYKVVHRVTKNCLHKVFVSEQIAGQLKVAIYPNPAVSDGRVAIELQGSATNATVEITDVSTGALVYQGTLEPGVPLVLENRTALRTGVYNVKVYNNEAVVNNRLIVN